MPPAIHAPVPVPQAQSVASMNTLPVKTINRYMNETAFTERARQRHYEAVGRWMHVKHWKGNPQRSKDKRASGRKASKKAKNRRRRRS